ncbi:SDR family oxidoreductase [Polynucleobacter sp. MWH-S4W17]|uniref:dTDP-4-dehydrorhamnose reductase family protein n=1 Tax=Polynucleobacter sp. MWH-S4W17 TaxID=1855910 RepID=UPI001BFD7BE0|nr:SDR family oxidoreductase [Polynucleobacter sp. MWH-S4W17]QWD81939.1 SDR family oxidoreductase [Polynucleobacter sp. MWH-S4W17]
MTNKVPVTSILVLGASGMLGNAVLRFFADSDGFTVIGTVRSRQSFNLLPKRFQNFLISDIDIENMDCLVKLFSAVRPSVVINCIGLVKQLSEANDPLSAIPINSLLPHRLARMCALTGARLVHMSTDCVFSGEKGMYVEADAPDAHDLYGRSKYLGEVDYPNAITLRTSIIGHELNGVRSLVDWFLSQQGEVKGFSNAFFSGLPTVEIARIIRDFVIPHPDMHGTYHVSADSINKFNLLKLIANVYSKKIDIIPDESLVIDRSLDSTRFRGVTGFHPKPWEDLITAMHEFS